MYNAYVSVASDCVSVYIDSSSITKLISVCVCVCVCVSGQYVYLLCKFVHQSGCMLYVRVRTCVRACFSVGART